MDAKLDWTATIYSMPDSGIGLARDGNSGGKLRGEVGGNRCARAGDRKRALHILQVAPFTHGLQSHDRRFRCVVCFQFNPWSVGFQP
jgi:hypothetical protein